MKVIADKYTDTISKAKAGKIDEIVPEHQLRYYKTIKQIQKDNKKMPESLTWSEGNQPNLWIYGPTGMFFYLLMYPLFNLTLLGTGKSYFARHHLQNHFYSKIASNKWWDKYDNEENVLIEDMDLSHAYQGYYLKIWADKYAFPVEVKNSGDLIRPKIIVVTSNYSIKEVFPDKSIHEPLLRRFHEIKKEVPYDATVNTYLVNVPNNTGGVSKKFFTTRKINREVKVAPKFTYRNGQLEEYEEKQKKLSECINISDTESSTDEITSSSTECSGCESPNCIHEETDEIDTTSEEMIV